MLMKPIIVSVLHSGNSMRGKLRTPFFSNLAFLIFTILITSTAFAFESGLNFYGFSYHPDRRDSRGYEFREFNPGLGYHLNLYDHKHAILFADAGLFLNSASRSTAFSVAGAELKI